MQLLSAVAGILLLGFAAEKCRELDGRNRGERFTFTDCFDMGVGSAACLVKEMMKLYLYYIRAIYVQKVRSEAAHKALAANLSVEAAREAGEAAARRAKLHVRHVMGPVLSAAWDLFETLYVGGTPGEGIVRSAGTLAGAYGGGIAGEGRMGWVGFVGGSQLGGWAGGRLGLMVYDVWNGVRLLLHRMHASNHVFNYQLLSPFNY